MGLISLRTSDQVPVQVVVRFDAGVEGDVGLDALALDVVGFADQGRLDPDPDPVLDLVHGAVQD